MTPSEIVLDAIAEMVVAEPRSAQKAISLGLENVIVALCIESGMSQLEARVELETRIELLRANQRRAKLISVGLESFMIGQDSIH